VYFFLAMLTAEKKLPLKIGKFVRQDK